MKPPDQDDVDDDALRWAFPRPLRQFRDEHLGLLPDSVHRLCGTGQLRNCGAKIPAGDMG